MAVAPSIFPRWYDTGETSGAMMSTALLPQGFQQKNQLKYHADFLGPYTDNGISTISFKMCFFIFIQTWLLWLNMLYLCYSLHGASGHLFVDMFFFREDKAKSPASFWKLHWGARDRKGTSHRIQGALEECEGSWICGFGPERGAKWFLKGITSPVF